MKVSGPFKLAARQSGRLAVAGLAAAMVSACATRAGPDAADARHGPAMDTARMCEVHELMMAGSSPEEQQTMLEQHLKAMHGFVDQQMVDRHRRAMAEKCPAESPQRR